MDGICGAEASMCVCAETTGHDGPHVCENTDRCGGKWLGDPDGNDFRPVVMPGDDGSPLAQVFNLLGGIG